MNKAKANYAKKCKSKIVTFYIKDKELYEYANKINFQDYVKTCLRIQLAIEKAIKEHEEIREA